MELQNVLEKSTSPLSSILFSGKLAGEGSVASFSGHHHSPIIRTVILLHTYHSSIQLIAISMVPFSEFKDVPYYGNFTPSKTIVKNYFFRATLKYYSGLL